MSTLLDVNNDNDLVKMLLLKSILSTEREAEDYFKNISKVNDAELIDNSNICIKDQINILQKKCQNKNDFMECNIENCNDMLQFNEQIISLLLDLKRHITSALQECERKLTIIERSLQKYMVGDTKVLICNPGMPYFKDKHYFFASNNEDEILKENHKELQLRNLPKFSPWTEKERNVLLKAIRKEPIMDGKIDKSRKATTQFSSTDFLELINPLQKREFDWFKISSTYFEDIHSPLDCHVMWNVFLHAKINKNYWTKSEDAKLKEIVKKCKFQNWDKIAKDLNTGRTAYQCFIRYNTTKKLPKIKNCTWENEEDKRLSKLIEIFKIGDFIPWGEIANWTLNRTKQQIYFRWTYSLAPYLIKGRFTKMEDKILKNAITLYGTNFRKISAAMMPNRSTVQLHDRYQTLSTNQIANWNLWTLEEDTKLLNFFEHIGPNWSMIAKEFSCKTRTQLRHRYTALQKYIKRGISLSELHKHDFYNETEKEEGQKNTNGEFYKHNNDMISKDYDIDKKLIEYFRTKYKVEKFLHNWKLYNMKTLEYNAIKLYNVLKTLNAKLCIPNDISDIKLNDRNQQLLYSLKEYIRLKSDKKRYLEIIDKYKLRMFGTNEINKDSYFVPPPPFDSRIKLKKSKRSQCINYNLNTKNNFLLEEPIDFDTPNFVISYIGGNEQELQFQKLSRLFQNNDLKCEQSFNIQKYSTFSKKMTLHKQFFNSESNRNNSSDIMFKKMASTDHSDVDASSFENINNNPQHVKLQSKCYKKLEVTQIYNIPIMYATRATLLSFKNLMYLKRLNEKDNNSSKSFIQSPEFQKMFNLLESRIEQLFKYPIGLSKTVLPEVYVMDTFSYNDITSKRKISETLD
ncbi:PREDICTED: uncharacterized protein LOC108548617 [Eufriesea mexicana]|uniref:uncharacterized protein LOC108548617 n=1 Tax=Eufriesea mexicana TaxID=516756 RepID=UPI00083C52F5|nr:PREDICTED: uncharacterized protein LOC108548617 [Eufriesea mexicana]